MSTQFLEELSDGSRVPVTEWDYLEKMATRQYVHVISQERLVIFKKWMGR
jgi:hypothetical protein